MSRVFFGESEDSGSDLESLKHFDRKSILCQVSSKSVRKWTIYTANAGPTDLLESPPTFNRKFILCQVSSKSVREWTIYTANARPMDFLESPTTFDRKYIFCQVSSNILRKWTIYPQELECFSFPYWVLKTLSRTLHPAMSPHTVHIPGGSVATGFFR